MVAKIVHSWLSKKVIIELKVTKTPRGGLWVLSFESEPRISHENRDESVGVHFNPCSKDGFVACMELEDESGMVSSD